MKANIYTAQYTVEWRIIFPKSNGHNGAYKKYIKAFNFEQIDLY